MLVVFLGRQRKLLDHSSCSINQKLMSIFTIIFDSVAFIFLASFGMFSYNSAHDTRRSTINADTGRVISSYTYSSSMYGAGVVMVLVALPAILAGLYCFA